MSDEKETKIESLGLDEAIKDLKFLAQKVSDMSKDLMQKAAEQAERDVEEAKAAKGSNTYC